MNLLEMTITGSAVILVILLIRTLLLYKLPKNAFLLFWLVAAIRLVIPFTISSSLSIYSFIGNLPVQPVEDHTTISEWIPETWTPVYIGENINGTRASAISGPTVIWLSGMVITLIAFAIAYGICFSYLRKSYPLSNQAIEKWKEEHKIHRRICFLQNERITSPLTYGIIHPQILIPSTMDWDDAEQNNLILEHEFCHIRRFDFLLKMGMAAVTCIHWFNPLVWIMYFVFQRDLELSCDEYVVQKKGFGVRSQYACTLIAAEENKSRVMSVCGEFHFGSAKERIKAIMLFKPISKGKHLAAFLLLCVMILSFLTSGNAAAVSDVSDVSALPAESTENTESGAKPDSEIIETTIPALDKKQWSCPMEYKRVSFPFGDQVHPITQEIFTHEGVNLAASEGTKVVASRSGVISDSGYDRISGNFLAIDHGDGYITVYSHLKDVLAPLGQTVSKGEEIGTCGNTGTSTGPHLSFYIYYEGEAVDPMQYIG